ncbi:DNA ligase 4-like [Argopecten irradians]|uniref:DNA ligase 4-like n=1 Tax=Argopecten irradians TaxID=31199 RepID=UPI0037110E57
MADVDADDKPTVTVASKVSFAELCGLLEKISKTQGNDKKKRTLTDFVDKWRDFHNSLHKDGKDTTADSFYPAMRLLLPHHEKERVAYGIKEHMLAKLLIEVLCLGKDSADANRLLNYKAPKTARADAGDFAGVTYFVLKNRCPEKGTLTIQEVNDCLDGIAQNNAAKKKDLVRKNVLRLLTNMSAIELKWLIRMIVKELKVGLSQASVLSVYHPDAEDFFNVNNNLEKVCRMLRDRSVRVHEIGISIFSPFSPMLGERASPDEVEKLMDGKTYFIETKFDGERMLLHKRENEYKYFSRSANEYTATFGSNSFDGNFTPFIHDLFKPGIKSCILDGEMLGYHAATKTYATKAMNTDIKRQQQEGYQPCYNIFDIVVLNDKVLTNKPIRERLQLLQTVIEPEEGRVQISQHTEANTNQECADALNKAIDGREEGIMVKNPESVYRPNTRKGGWIKIKPEYVGGLMDELDVLVVGGYLGVGHRGGMMSHFLCAVAVATDDGEKPEVFHSFCKVGSGYSKKELGEFNEKLKDHWKVFDKRNPPTSVILASGFKEKPDAWIEPCNSCIVQIKAAEIIDSDRFKTGCTLRFPRVECFRDDKAWHECMTLADILELKEKSGGKLAGGKVQLNDGEEPVKKKRKVVSRVVRPTLGAQFKGADVASITQVSKMLEGKEFCVVNGPSAFPKHAIETKIVELGGRIVQNPGPTTFCVLADKVAVRVNNLIRRDVYDVVKVTWFQRCVQASRWIPWSPADMIHVSPKTQQDFQKLYDEYGDSYVDPTSPDQLETVFGRITKVENDMSDPQDIAEIEEAYFPDDSPYGLFRTCRFYLDNSLVINDKTTKLKNSTLDFLALELRFFGGVMSEGLDQEVSHVMVDKSDLSRLEEIRQIRRQRKRKFHIVTKDWVRQCMEEGTLVSARSFEPS